MASEDTGEPVAVDVPDEVRSWLQRAADQRGMPVEAYVRELLRAHRAVERDAVDGDAIGLADLSGEFEGTVDDGLDDVVDDRLEDAVDDRLDEVRGAFHDHLEDVRDRVIQVKRETDAKAPADHDHAELEAEVADVAEGIDDLASDLADHREEVDALRRDLDDGFENFEEVLEYLLDTTDDLLDRMDRLARATIGTRERLQALASAVSARDRADELKRDAALEGVTAADCEDCGRSVRAALLTAAECPYCAAGFVDVEPKEGLLGSATFHTGARPALAGGDRDAVSEQLEEEIDADRPDPGSIDWDTRGGEE